MPVNPWTTRIVVVIATFAGKPTAPTQGRLHARRSLHDPQHWWHNTSNLTFVVYQRLNPSQPNYSPNHGFEGGVVVQFIVDNFWALPEITVFMQDRPEQHNPHWLAWTQCLRPNMSYAPMTNARMARQFKANAQTAPGTEADDAITDQCWRDLLDAFGSPLLSPREQPFVSYFQGSTFAVSRAQLHTTPYATWQRVHGMIAGGDGRCHRGPLQWERLSVVRKRHTRSLDTPDAHGKHTSANAFEALQHHVVGGLGREDVFMYDYCKSFVPDCHKTPCQHVRPSPKYHANMLSRIEYERRRLGREYKRVLTGIRRVATAIQEAEHPTQISSPRAAALSADSSATSTTAPAGEVSRTFWREFGWLLGEKGGGTAADETSAVG